MLYLQIMKIKIVFLSVLLGLMLVNPGLLAQEETIIKSEQVRFYRHTLSVGGGITFIRLAGQLGTTQASGIFVPSLNMDYFVHLNPKWELGLMGGYELIHYMIIDSQLERDKALHLALVGKYNFTPHLGAFLGGGMEFEKHDNRILFRLGAEYSIDLKGKWELLPRLYLDLKENYNTWSLTFTLARQF